MAPISSTSRRATALWLWSSTAHGTFAGSFESAPPKSSSIMIGWISTTPMKALSWRITVPSRYAIASTLRREAAQPFHAHVLRSSVRSASAISTTPKTARKSSSLHSSSGPAPRR